MGRRLVGPKGSEVVRKGELEEEHAVFEALHQAHESAPLHQSLQHAQQCTPTCSSCSLPGARSPYLTLLSFKSSKKKLVSHHFVHTLAGCLLVAFSEKTCDVERQSRSEEI